MATQFLEHLSADGDRWDSLAWRYYSNPYGYGPILEANPALLNHALIPSGLRIQIPVLAATPTQANENLPPWRR